MRHRKSRTRLTNKPSQEKMFKRNLVTSLLLYESVRTTKRRAQVVAPIVDRLVNIAKTKTPHVAIRSINKVVTDKNASRKLMEVYRDRFSDRNSGLTRITPAGARKGDGAELVDIEILAGKAPKKESVSVEKKAEKSETPKTDSTNTQKLTAKTSAKSSTSKAPKSDS